MPKLIIGLVGTDGSGKSYVSKYLADRYGGRVFKFSDYLSRVLDVLAIEKSRENMIKLSVALRREYGENALAYAVARDVMALDSNALALVDGIRRVDDVAPLEPLPNFVLLGIDANQHIRFERMKGRGEKAGEAGLTWERFLAEDSAPTETAIPQVLERARYRINNNGTAEELEAELQAIAKELNLNQ